MVAAVYLVAEKKTRFSGLKLGVEVGFQESYALVAEKKTRFSGLKHKLRAAEVDFR